MNKNLPQNVTGLSSLVLQYIKKLKILTKSRQIIYFFEKKDLQLLSDF